MAVRIAGGEDQRVRHNKRQHICTHSSQPRLSLCSTLQPFLNPFLRH